MAGTVSACSTPLVHCARAAQPRAAPACLPRVATSLCRTSRRNVSVRSTDYSANAADEGVLQLPPKMELSQNQLQNVFGYDRDLQGRYIMGKVIGAGSFGVVREAVQKATGLRFAVKSVPKAPKRGVPTPRYLLKLRQEVEAMQQLGASLDAVYLADVFEDDSDVHMVMELCEGGALIERLNDGALSERAIARLVKSVLRFIAQCHAKGIVYRDVKPDNFLFVSKEPNSPLKATDFGLSIRHALGERPLTSRSGTPAYMAPEVIMQSYNNKADIWSVGMLTYQLLTGRFPFWENIRSCTLQEVWKSILTESGRLDLTALRGQVSEDGISFMQGLLQRDPSRRLSATAALQHPWVRDNGGGGGGDGKPLDGSVVQRLQRFATYGTLKQQVLRVITDELAISTDIGKEALKRVYELFTTIDSDSNGTIDMKEFRNGLRALGYILTDTEVAQLMARMDLNKDGTVDFSELAASLIDWQQFQGAESQWDEWVDTVFDRLDRDGNGYVDMAEIMEYVPSVGASPDATLAPRSTSSAASQMVREVDSNGDGLISREEFRAILADAADPDSLNNYDMRLLPAVDEELMSISGSSSEADTH